MAKESKNLFDPGEYQVKGGVVPMKNIEHCILVFDIVGFSQNMVNDKMLEIVGDIHTAVFETLDPEHYWAEKGSNANLNSLILIPTGDGYGIALNNKQNDEEILVITQKLYGRLKREGLKFRMGIAKGRNVLKIDLNDNLNIFGYGIVLATRVCNLAKEMQILVENGLAESLLQQKEINELQKINEPYEVKHNFKINCYNYYKENVFGIKIEK